MKMLLSGILLIMLTGTAFAADKVSDEERILNFTAEALKDMKPLTALDMKEMVKSGEQQGSLIVSLQPLEEYNLGHIPGAVHLTFDLAELDKSVSALPKDKNIILVSANGQEACKVAVVLRQLGYEASFMMLGMNAYNRLYAGSGAYMGNVSGEVSTEVKDFSPAAPEMTYSEQGTDLDLIKKTTAAYAARRRPFNITAYDLMQMDEAVLISMQNAEDYAKGHIPGTINIPGPDFIAGDKRLLQLPKGKKIIVTCYIGHYSSMGTMILNQMGYEAYSLTWGLSGWNLSESGERSRDMLTKGFGFEVTK